MTNDPGMFLFGLMFWGAAVIYDWFVWHGLLTATQFGAIVGLTLLCVYSVPMTIVLFIIGLVCMGVD